MAMDETSCSSAWTREQEKAFENAIATYTEDSDGRWEKIAAEVEGKTVEEIKQHYQLLEEDVNDIESGQVPLPSYLSSSEGGDHTGEGSKKGGHGHGDSGQSGKASKSEQERKKGIAWTEDEHKLFLLGLDKYGKGDWRSISRNYVISRTPTQVASHAQKYFIRLNSMNRDRRRTSIHDITSIGNGDVSSSQGPITGQTNGLMAATPSGKSSKQPQHSGGPPGIGMYGTTIGQPVGGPLIPAVGTPVNMTVPSAPHMAYGIRSPLSGTVVPGAPVNIPPVTYPMPPPSSR